MTSIWTGIDYQSFRRDVASLHQIARGKDLSQSGLYSNRLNSEVAPHSVEGLRSTWLPFRTEKQLAEDFAFVASCEDTPACVSAATISRGRHNDTTYLSVAANQGVQKAVDKTLQQLVDGLRRCALRSKSGIST